MRLGLPAMLTAMQAEGTVQRLALRWPRLGEAREAWVWLPPGGEDLERRSPVAHRLDGQNVLGPAAPHGGRQARQAVSALAAEGRRLLLVALPHGGGGRWAAQLPGVLRAFRRYAGAVS